MIYMVNITVYTSLDKGVEDIEVKAKELALLLSYYTGGKINLNIVIIPLSSPDVIVPSVRVNDLLFNDLDVSEIISKIIMGDAMYSILSSNNAGTIPVV